MPENKWLIYGVLGAGALIVAWGVVQYLNSGSSNTAANSQGTSSQGGASWLNGAAGAAQGQVQILPVAAPVGNQTAPTPQGGGSTQTTASGSTGNQPQSTGSTQATTAFLQGVANALTGTVVSGSGLTITQSASNPSQYTYQSGGQTITGSIPGSLLTASQSQQAAAANLANVQAQLNNPNIPHGTSGGYSPPLAVHTVGGGPYG